uniref:Mediator of RNA polymerase II transcription subunit 23 n=1 Tax=Caenorhabditis tropicalis TaxID=1561998 RepID=A0A1I7US87_9PELO
MSVPMVKLEKPILDFKTRQVAVFEEVIENFQEKCCDAHQPERQKIADKARRALQTLQSNWDEKEARERRQLAVISNQTGIPVEDLMVNCKNNIIYHRYALKLAQWCLKLSQLQKKFQRTHQQQLLTMKMPPGSHEVSERQFKMHFQTSLTAYMVLCTYDEEIPHPSPAFILFMNQIICRSRVHPDPTVYHMMSLFIEHVVQDANRLLLES